LKMMVDGAAKIVGALGLGTAGELTKY